jgi:hypothetical protein
MATVVGTTQWDAFLKELYPDGAVPELSMRKHPFYSMVAKEDGFVGDYEVVPVFYDVAPGRSADIASLLSATGPVGPSSGVKFLLTRAHDYAAIWLDAETIYASMTDRGAFAQARKHEIDSIITSLGNSISHALYRSGSGSLGTISSATNVAAASGNKTITLVNRSDAKYFVKGGQLAFAALENSGALRAFAVVTSVSVVSVDEDAGTILTDVPTDLGTNITGVAAGDYIFYLGDRLTGAAGQKIKGLAAWLPLTAPTTGDSFFGVDRSVHPTRLAGSRLNQSTYPAEDSILELAEVISERGGAPERAFVSPRQFTKMAKRLNAKVEYEGAGGTANYSFAGIKVHTSAGTVTVTPDPDCPDDRGYLLEMSSWTLRHMKEIPHIVTDDGVSAQRRSALDQIEIRARYWAQLRCRKPGHNGVFSCSL